MNFNAIKTCSLNIRKVMVNHEQNFQMCLHGIRLRMDCNAKTENEIMILMKDHTNKCHNLKKITKTLQAKLRP